MAPSSGKGHPHYINMDRQSEGVLITVDGAGANIASRLPNYVNFGTAGTLSLMLCLRAQW